LSQESWRLATREQAMKPITELSKAFLGTLTITLALVAQAEAQTFLTNGLVAYYPFSGNANDASGHGMDGVVHGATLTADRFGNTNSAYSFNGTSAYIVSSNKLSDMPSATASCWINIPDFAVSDGYILMDGDTTGGHDFGIEVWYGTNIVLWTKDDTHISEYRLPLTNTWFQVVAVAEASTNVVKMWLNGQLMSTSSSLGNANVGYHSQLCIGCRAVYNDHRFKGAIDDVRLYNRALSDSEVQQLYQYESTPHPCTPQPATATARVDNGFVVEAIITDGGCGYTNTPLVLIQGGGGTGAAATAILSSGIVVQILMTDAGFGYTSSPSILIGSPPSIITEPQSVAINVGNNASFSVTAVGDPPPSYQWSLNGTNISSAISSSLTVSNAAESNLGSYVVAVSNPFGTTNSSSAILSMYPFLKAPFLGAVAYWGQPATLSVEAGGSGPFIYQWFQNGSAVTGATNPVLSFANLQFTNAGVYSVVVGNSFGSVTNTPAQVVVNPAGISLGLYPGVTISGVVGYDYLIQRTADLADTNSWVTVANLILAQPVQLWVDTNIDASLPTNPHHFYQVLPGP
jgi:hypothetical protein